MRQEWTDENPVCRILVDDAGTRFFFKNKAGARNFCRGSGMNNEVFSSPMAGHSGVSTFHEGAVPQCIQIVGLDD